MTDMTFPLPKHNPAVLEFLENRRSNLAKIMTGPGPDAAERDRLLRIAARVPDHRKLTPWRFIVFEGEARSRAGQIIAQAYQRGNPDHPEDRVGFEAERFLRAPLVVAVVSAPKQCPRGTPKWEQQLSAGAVCLTLCMAAQASGWAAQWLTEWYAYDLAVCEALGLDSDESIAGFIYIGMAATPATERARPVLADIKSEF